MRSSNSSLTPDDKKVARQIGRIVLLLYSSAALMLTAWIMAHIALRNSTTAKLSIEAVAVPGVPTGALSRR
jgi:hypothetical protein